MRGPWMALGLCLALAGWWRAERRVARLRTQATTDALTGLLNRQAFCVALDSALAQGRRWGRLFAVLLVDVDHFKAINDRLGHPAGDRVLADIGARLAAGVRQTDQVARLGGDEFAILLTDLAHPADAQALAARLLDAAAGDEPPAHARISIGVAVWPGEPVGAEAMIARADTALYAAKAAGRGVWRAFD